MKALYLFSGLLLTCYACTEFENIPDDMTLSSNIITRTSENEEYNVLGYGYDITDEYLGINSIKLKILDITSFTHNNYNRLENLFIGEIDQRCYAGADANFFLSQLISDSNFNGSIASLLDKDKKDESGLFSATVTAGFKSNSKYSYSTQYSFARAEIYKKQRKYQLNADIEKLTEYLSPSFIEDLKKYTADKIVEMYGTHVLTNIIVGGTYTAYYKSTIVKENNYSEKTKIVSAGAKFNLSKIGLDANGSWSRTEVEELNKENSNWECYIKSIGGSTSGTTITFTPNQGPTFTINLGDWTKSVDDEHSRLVDIDWNATYPIYDLISDPIKKEEIKKAVLKYINSKKIEVLKTSLIYRSYNGKDHYYASFYSPTYGNGNWTYEGVPFSIYNEQVAGTVPYYQYWNYKDHFYTTDYFPSGIDGYELNGILGYVYIKPNPEAVPLYRYWNGYDHYYALELGYFEGYRYECIACYVLP